MVTHTESKPHWVEESAMVTHTGSKPHWVEENAMVTHTGSNLTGLRRALW